MSYPPNQQPPQELFQPDLRPVFVSSLEHSLANLRTEAWQTVPTGGIDPTRRHLYATSIVLTAANREGALEHYSGGRSLVRHFPLAAVMESYTEFDGMLRERPPEDRGKIIMEHLEPIRRTTLYPEIQVVKLLATDIKAGYWDDRSGSSEKMLHMVIPHVLAVQGLTAAKILRRQGTPIPAPRTPFIPQQQAATR